MKRSFVAFARADVEHNGRLLGLNPAHVVAIEPQPNGTCLLLTSARTHDKVFAYQVHGSFAAVASALDGAAFDPDVRRELR